MLKMFKVLPYPCQRVTISESTHEVIIPFSLSHQAIKLDFNTNLHSIWYQKGLYILGCFVHFHVGTVYAVYTKHLAPNSWVNHTVSILLQCHCSSALQAHELLFLFFQQYFWPMWKLERSNVLQCMAAVTIHLTILDIKNTNSSGKERNQTSQSLCKEVGQSRKCM